MVDGTSCSVARSTVSATSWPTLDVKALVAYVYSRRTPEGGYSYYRSPAWGVEEPNAFDTLAALEVLSGSNQKVPSPSATVSWLCALQEDSGDFASLAIGWAAMRAMKILGVSPRYSPKRWLVHMGSMLASLEGPRRWNEMIVALSRLTDACEIAGIAPPKSLEVTIADLLEIARDREGGWARPGADLETTAIALTLGASHVGQIAVSELAFAFVRRCEDQELGFRLSPSGRATAVSALWGGLRCLRVWDAQPTFPRAIAAQLVLLQRPDGGLGERHHSLSSLWATWRGVEVAHWLCEREERS